MVEFLKFHFFGIHFCVVKLVVDAMLICAGVVSCTLSDGDVATFFASRCDMHVCL